jgi:hypothetical protein
MPPSPHKKRKQTATDKAENKKSTHADQVIDRAALHASIGYAPLTLKQIHDRFQDLCRQVPAIPAGNFRLEVAAPAAAQADHNGDKSLPVSMTPCLYDKVAIRAWATDVQNVLQEFRLLVACSSPATYVWGTDRSGAAEQNLGLLSQEFARSQEHISARVTPHLNDILAPVVTLVTDKTVTTKTSDTVEVKQNFFVTTPEDPDYVDLCYTVLATNAELLRQVVLSNFDKLLQAIEDYLAAQHKDNQHDARGFVY